MGKKSKNNTPSTTTTSSININGTPYVATTSNKNGVTTNINYTPEQSILNSYINQTLLQSIPKINTFLPETIENMNAEIEAYTQKGIKMLNDIYNPMIKNTQNNIAARFGGLDNSIFLDSLNSIESKRADSVSGLVQDMQAKRSDLENNELAKQYNLINFLNSYQNQQFQNMLNTANMTNSINTANNNYQYQLSNSNSKNSSADYQQMLQAIQLAAMFA